MAATVNIMPGSPTFDRRRFLVRSARLSAAGTGLMALAGGSGALLSACGRVTRPPELVALFSTDRVVAAGLPQRLPFAIVDPGDDTSVVLPPDDGVVELELRRDGEVLDRIEVEGHIVDHDHVGDVDPDHQHADLFRYYPARLTLPEPGIYDLVVTVPSANGGYAEQPQAMLAVQGFDPAEITLPLPGRPMPAVATPTFADPSGVDRLCTRFEPCPFHADSFASVVGSGRPSALLVATPAFCSTAYCGPVLETLIEASASAPDVAVVHAEVYANPEEVGGNFADPAIRPAPAVEALRLPFEPSLFLVDSTGMLVDRIDNVFDLSEARAALTALD